MIKMKNAIENLEKQRTTDESQRARDEAIQQLKKITENITQIERHEAERVIWNHPERDHNLEQTRIGGIEKVIKEMMTLNEMKEIKETLKV